MEENGDGGEVVGFRPTMTIHGTNIMKIEYGVSTRVWPFFLRKATHENKLENSK